MTVLEKVFPLSAKKTNRRIGIFLNSGYIKQTKTSFCRDNSFTGKWIYHIPYILVRIMANIIYLVVASLLLVVSVYFLISYIKDQKKTKLTFNKRKW